MDSDERGMNPVAATIIIPWKEYLPSLGSNLQPAIFKSDMLSTELWGSASFFNDYPTVHNIFNIIKALAFSVLLLFSCIEVHRQLRQNHVFFSQSSQVNKRNIGVSVPLSCPLNKVHRQVCPKTAKHGFGLTQRQP